MVVGELVHVYIYNNVSSRESKKKIKEKIKFPV